MFVQATVSADGRFVIFSDSASNLVANDTNGAVDIFSKDLGTGAVQRLSQSISGEEANAGSLFPAFARRGYNSDAALSAFASAASNLVAGDTEGISDIFFSRLTIPALPLSKETTINVPPDATLDDANKNLSLSLEEFAGVNLSGNSKRFLQQAKSSRVKYTIKLNQNDVPRKKADDRSVSSKKSEYTFKNLKPGSYSVKYRAEVLKGRKVVSRTPYSPTLKFNTLGN
jgi:hypothetical protein